MTRFGRRAANFWANVDMTGECWEWSAGRYPNGYGRSSDGRETGGQTYAHRRSWELYFGPIPDGLYVCHHCDHPPCVRPFHLFLGTATDNAQDAIAKGRRPRAA